MISMRPKQSRFELFKVKVFLLIFPFKVHLDVIMLQ